VRPEALENIAHPHRSITTRQNIQLHWVKKENIVNAIREISKSGYFTINGCGDILKM
jgi:sulfite reductase (NADPH) hemoprotein beta-component